MFSDLRNYVKIYLNHLKLENVDEILEKCEKDENVGEFTYGDILDYYSFAYKNQELFESLSKTASFYHCLATSFEGENDYENSVECYQKAIELYGKYESHVSEMMCRDKMANLLFNKGEISKAVEIYEKIGFGCANHRMLKYSARYYFTAACLCHIFSKEYNQARSALERYCDIDNIFKSALQPQIILDICDACERNDLMKFDDILAKTCQNTFRDCQWDMLKDIRKTISH